MNWEEIGLDILADTVEAVTGDWPGLVAGILTQIGAVATTAAQTATSTGQGLLGGLISYGGGVLSGLTAVGNYLFQGLSYIGDQLAGIMSPMAEGILGFASTFGNYFWSSLYALGNWIWTAQTVLGQALAFLWNALAGAIEAIWSFEVGTLTTWFNDIATSANGFIGSLVTTWRGKMKQTIVADMALYFGWKGAESALGSLATLGGSGEGFMATAKSAVTKLGIMIFEPFAAVIGGAILGELLDSLIPSTDITVQLVPTFSLTSSEMSLPRMASPTGSAGPAGAAGIPTYQDSLGFLESMEQGVGYINEDSDLTNRAEAESDTVTGANAYLKGESLNRSESLTITNS